MTTLAADKGQPALAGRWTVPVFALLGLALGLIVFSGRASTYEAEALVSVTNPQGPLSEEITVVTGSAVLNAAAGQLGFQPDISVSAAEVARLLTITATNEDAAAAAQAANVVANAYVQSPLGAPATIAQQADVPTSTTGVGPLIYAALGTLLGALVGAGISFLQQQRSAASARSPREPDDEFDENVLPTDYDDPMTNPVAAPSQGLDQAMAAPNPVVSPDASAVAGATLDAAAPTSKWRSADIHPTTPASPPVTASLPEPETEPAAHADDDTGSFFAAALGDTQAESVAAPSTSPVAAPEPSAPPTPPTPELDPDPVSAPMPMPEPPVTSVQPVAAVVDDDPTGAEEDTDAIFDIETEVNTDMGEPDATFDDSLDEDQADESADNDAEFYDYHAAEADLDDLDRWAAQKQFESARYELLLEHEERVAQIKSEHERQLAAMRSDIVDLNKQLRVQGQRLKSHTGTNQTRVGDLEAQVDALEVELAALRQTLERERIAHAKRLTDDRGVADRALDNARREYREELAKHVRNHRQALADYRADLDQELARDRAKHAAALEAQHQEYENQHEAERNRAEARIVAADSRHEREISELDYANRAELERQAAQHKDTIASLRTSTEATDAELRALDKENKALRSELSSVQKQLTTATADAVSTERRLSDEATILQAEIDAERQRNAALRADVLRRSAEAHQVVDRAVEERTAQLAELEASVTRQREYADARVREISAEAEEHAREAASREAKLTATVSRLTRELEELKRARGTN